MSTVFWRPSSIEVEILKNSNFKLFSLKKFWKNIHVYKVVMYMCTKFHGEIPWNETYTKKIMDFEQWTMHLLKNHIFVFFFAALISTYFIIKIYMHVHYASRYMCICSDFFFWNIKVWFLNFSKLSLHEAHPPFNIFEWVQLINKCKTIFSILSFFFAGWKKFIPG